jgi:cellulose synthase/poly-beta-1,6-N-acetylglucosamine synthase-like glycosyltransferase
MVWNYLAAIGAFIWLTIIFLPWRPWGTREYMDSPADSPDTDLGDVTVLIPARNEAEVMGT